jgi:hypothetical protein
MFTSTDEEEETSHINEICDDKLEEEWSHKDALLV